MVVMLQNTTRPNQDYHKSLANTPANTFVPIQKRLNSLSHQNREEEKSLSLISLFSFCQSLTLCVDVS